MIIGNFGPRRVRLAVAAQLWQERLTAAVLRGAGEAGYAGCELSPAAGERDPESIFARSGIDIVPDIWRGSLLGSTVEEELARIDAWADQLARSRTGMIVYAEGQGEDQEKRQKLTSEEFKAYGTKLSRVARDLKRRGLRLVFAHAPGSPVATADEIAVLMDNTAATVGFQIDTGWLASSGGAMTALVRKYASRLSHLRCRDLTEDGDYTVPGEGGIDFSELFRSLAAIKYGGWIVVAGGRPEPDALIMAINGREHLEPLLDENGLVVIDEQDK